MGLKRSMRTSQALIVFGLTVSWWACAVAVTVAMKAVLDFSPGHFFNGFHFPYPLSLTFLSNLASAVLMSAATVVLDKCLRRRASSEEPLLQGQDPEQATPACLQFGAAWSDRLGLVLMGTIQGLALGAKNEALMRISVSMRTMIFSTSVLMVMLVARLFGLEKFSLVKLLSLLLLTVGGMLQGGSFWNRCNGDVLDASALLGIILAVAAMFLDALRWVLLQFVFMKTVEIRESIVKSPISPVYIRKLVSAPVTSYQVIPWTKLHMVAWVMWATLPMSLWMSWCYELPALRNFSDKPAAVSGIVTALSIGVVGINLTEFGIVQYTSPLTFNVLSYLHNIPMIFAGIIFFGDEVKGIEVMGFTVCLVGAMLYSCARQGEPRKC